MALLVLDIDEAFFLFLALEDRVGVLDLAHFSADSVARTHSNFLLSHVCQNFFDLLLDCLGGSCVL